MHIETYGAIDPMLNNLTFSTRHSTHRIPPHHFLGKDGQGSTNLKWYEEGPVALSTINYGQALLV